MLRLYFFVCIFFYLGGGGVSSSILVSGIVFLRNPFALSRPLWLSSFVMKFGETIIRPVRSSASAFLGGVQSVRPITCCYRSPSIKWQPQVCACNYMYSNLPNLHQGPLNYSPEFYNLPATPKNPRRIYDQAYTKSLRIAILQKPYYLLQVIVVHILHGKMLN